MRRTDQTGEQRAQPHSHKTKGKQYKVAILNVYRRQTATTTTTSKYRIKIKYRNDNDKTHVINTHSLISTQNTVRSVVRSASAQTHNATDYIGVEAASASHKQHQNTTAHTRHIQHPIAQNIFLRRIFSIQTKSREEKKNYVY